MFNITGSCGSEGFTSGYAVVKKNPVPTVEKYTVADPEAEILRFRVAQARYDGELSRLCQAPGLHKAEVEILQAYRVILHDEVFFAQALQLIQEDRLNAEYAILKTQQATEAVFKKLDDAYLQERLTDIQNVCTAFIRTLQQVEEDFAERIARTDDAIIVAEDLTPEETIKLDKKKLRGFILERGGVTSHVVILARLLGIPAVIGVRDATSLIQPGSHLLMNAEAGKIYVSPDERTLGTFAGQMQAAQKLKNERDTDAKKIALTRDGICVPVLVNAGSMESITAFDPLCCDGIGLLRTEFLYMGRDGYPDEEAQFQAYKLAAEVTAGKLLIIRTLDIGSDKQLQYMQLPPEDNPALGYRAIRVCLDRNEMFQAQLKAILRASVYGKVKIMFPMITTLEELWQAKAQLEAAKADLDAANICYNPGLEVGIMIETPAAVMLSDRLARECDFFSVGSNDLIQYTMAADRTNIKVNYLYNECNVSVLRMIHLVAQNAGNAQIPWGICGEVAANELLIPLWLAWSVSELSVSPSRIGQVKQIIHGCSVEALRQQADDVLSCATSAEVKERLAGLPWEKEYI